MKTVNQNNRSARGPREDSESSSAAARAGGGGAPPASNIAGWLLVLCALLLVYHPLSLALSASRALEALLIRGAPMMLVLAARALVTAIGIAAGLALVGLRPGAVTLARWSLVLSAVTDVFVYVTPYVPSNRFPGTTPFYVAASLAYHAIWLAYLFRSKRVRDTFQI